MKNMNNLNEGVSKFVGKMAIKLTEKSTSKCALFGFYEPKFPIEILKEQEEK